MTAGRRQSTSARRQSRIIERPRLTRLLDGMDARTILLTAPAGYGKTTLARQWGRTLSRAIWVTATAGHRDVVTFAEDVAAGVDALGGNASRFIGEYMRARSNPQRAGREIANALAVRVERVGAQWLVVDDYHELAESPEVVEMVTILHDRLSARFLLASRTRPDWITARHLLHGLVGELGPDNLAMTSAETTQLLGRRADLEPLIRRAQGWPAVLTLAAGLDAGATLEEPLPTMLHRYVAEELFHSASPAVRDGLITLGLLADLSAETVALRFSDVAEPVVEQAQALGFLTGADPYELHPLLREFLLSKLGEDPAAEGRVREAVSAALDGAAWGFALDLVLRFSLDDLVDPVLQRGFKPLVRSGRVGTLSTFASRIRQAPAFPVPAVDVVEAEIALREGNLGLAVDLARRVQTQLPDDHALTSRSNAILGQSQFFLADFVGAQASFEAARTTARDEPDENEALHGVAVATIFREDVDPEAAMAALRRDRHRSPQHLLRFATAELCRRRFDEGLRDPLPIDEPLHAFEQVEDPLVRTSFTNLVACSLAQRAEYFRASTFLELFAKDVEEFELTFAQPFLHWTWALVNLGLRRFGAVDRSLRIVERLAYEARHAGHAVNAHSLRSRLLLQTGQLEEALVCLDRPEDGPVLPSWRAEQLATRALALACIGDADEAEHLSRTADEMTRCVEVKVLSAAARAVSAAEAGNAESALTLMELAEALAIWDPVVCATRCSVALADTIAAAPEWRARLRRLWDETGDLTLSRRAGFRSSLPRRPAEVLSPREYEVLGLIAQGMRNRDIAAALYIAESTAKVHVRHVLEKLGVRSRAEAVGRYSELLDRGSRQAEATAASGIASSSVELDTI